MSGNCKRSKNNLKIDVKKCLCGECTDNIVFFYIQLINHHTYIVLSCYLIKTPTVLRFTAIIIY